MVTGGTASGSDATTLPRGAAVASSSASCAASSGVSPLSTRLTEDVTPATASPSSNGGDSPSARWNTFAGAPTPGHKEVRREWFHLANFDLDGRLDEFPEDPSEGHAAVLGASEEQHILMKSVANEDWVNLIRQLQSHRFRTSTSLSPPGGKNMRLFGKEAGTSCGLLWDRRKLDLSDAFIWPSGYFAKSHFNIDKDGKTLLNGRGDALVKLEDLVESNLQHKYWHAGRNEWVDNEPLPYNEVMTFVEGANGIVGIFSRSTAVMHLMWAMGIRALLLRTLPGAGELPVFVHDAERGLRPFGRAAQRRVVSEFLSFMHPPCGATGLPCLPVDAHKLGLTLQEQLELHGGYGVTEEALTSLVKSLTLESEEHDADDHNGGVEAHWSKDALSSPSHSPRQGRTCSKICPDKARGILAIGLSAAVKADNCAAALSLVEHVTPLLFGSSGYAEEEKHALPGLATSEMMVMPTPMKMENDFVTCLRSLVDEARSPNMLATVGATIALDDFASGRMLPRIVHACRQLEEWLRESDSVMFRLQSWKELNGHHVHGVEAPALSSFVTHKAIRNRTAFYNDLLELEKLEEAHDLLHGMTKLQTLVSAMHHPCLRLEILQHILGLDERYNLETVNNVVNVALHVMSKAVQVGLCTGEGRPGTPASVLPKDTGYAPSYQLAATACHMQGLDREGQRIAPAAVF